MSRVSQFELYQGVVLTKILRAGVDRGEKRVLRLVETRPRENWSTYTLNDTYDLLVTHTTSARKVSGGTSWTFVLSKNQLRQASPESKRRPGYIALVCARGKSTDGPMYVCLLEPDEVKRTVNFTARQQSLTVRKLEQKGTRLQLFKGRRVIYRIPMSRLEKWEIPGG